MTIIHFIILGILAMLLNLGALYVVIRLAVTHAINKSAFPIRLVANSRHAAEVFDKR